MGDNKRARNLGLLFAALSLLPRAEAQQSEATKIYSQSSKSVLLIFVKSADSKIVAQGTGFLVGGGKIITNKHVVEGGTALLDFGGARIPATIESIDDQNDIAVLTVAAEIDAEPLIFADTIPPPGSNVFAIGNPRGLEKSISTGILSAVRTVGKRILIQITTPISPGSSGGPVFDSSGRVVGVTVGTIEEGQNLNFAVPASAVTNLLRGESLKSVDFSSLVDRAQVLIGKRNTLEYSDAVDSPYQKNENEIRLAFSSAVARAEKEDAPRLLELSEQLANSWNVVDRDVAVLAAERAVKLASSTSSNLALAKALNLKASWLTNATDADQQKLLLRRSEMVARQAISMTKQPSASLYSWLGDTLEMLGSHQEAESVLRRALELSRLSPDTAEQAQILRDLVVAAQELKKPTEADKWFNSLAETGHASWWDWTQQAKRLDAAKRFAEAGESWQKAAELNYVWRNWCDAAFSFELAPDKSDLVLNHARKCISLGTGKKNSETILSYAHGSIAEVLNDRGVYEEALSQAKEASTLNSEFAWAYEEQGVALLGLRRYQEAINVEKAAIRLSDGKFGIMHFHLGSAYFATENWPFAKQSFEKAAELMPTSDPAAYNVALCLQRQSLFLDATHWYEEVLRRNPNRADKQDIVNLISTLRR
jgi:tetratricopeptide (TPR) repeat protein